jgi:hypothetical protein
MIGHKEPPGIKITRSTQRRTHEPRESAAAGPGHQDCCEELVRKVADAIPKVNEGNEIMTDPTVIGDLSHDWTARPLESWIEVAPPRTLDQGC